MHVPIASLKEHIGFGLPQDNFGDLVDVAVSRQAKARGQGLLVAADIKHLGQDEQRDQESEVPLRQPGPIMQTPPTETGFPEDKEHANDLEPGPCWDCVLPAVWP